MATRTGDFLHRPVPARRRSSLRQALAVIPDVTRLSVSLGSPISLNSINRNIQNPWYPTEPAISSSPDELVIQKRGRRSRAIIWSPEADSKRNSLLSYSLRDRTPEKVTSTTQSPIIFKKRLDLSDGYNETHLATPEPSKSSEVNLNQRFIDGNSLADGLRALNNEQLIKIIMDLISMQEEGTLPLNSELRDVISTIMPVANVYPLQEKVNELCQNFYGRLVSSNDSAYVSTYTHLDSYQKVLVEQANKLVESQHWNKLMQYVISAWTITKNLPECENHDNTSQKCFSSLAHFCKQALLNGNFVKSTLNIYTRKMDQMVKDCEDMKICLQMAKEMIQ